MYDGWNLIAERVTPVSGAETVTRYVWGLDLSQSLQGAGGIGGLLLQDTGTETRLYTYEANGNVGQLVDGTTGAVVAHYEYDPFGTTLTASGTEADANPFRFSTKYTDAETTLVYYGYRFYSPTLGRWLTRDPIEERGGNHLYAFVGNNGINSFDRLGRKKQGAGCNFCGPDVTQFLVNLVNSADEWRFSQGGISRAEGIAWLENYGMKLDWWTTEGDYHIKENDEFICPSLGECAHTFWLCGECVQDHWIGNFMYGYLGRLLSIPDIIMDVAANHVQKPEGKMDPPWDWASYEIARHVFERKTETSICQLIKFDHPNFWQISNNTDFNSGFLSSDVLSSFYPRPKSSGYESCKKCPKSLPQDLENTVPGGMLGSAWPSIQRNPRSFSFPWNR